MSTTLCTISSDALREILAYCRGSDVAALWLCGDGTLNMKLGQGGCARRFDLNSSEMTRQVWPRLISCFPRLVEISLNGLGETVRTKVFTPQDLLGLPKTLKKLSLCFPGAVVSFIRILVDEPSHWANLEYLDLTWVYGRDRVEAANHAALFKTARLPPRLEVFKWSAADQSVERNSCLSLENLPLSITSVRLIMTEISEIPSNWKMPPTLKSFWCSGRNQEEISNTLLPTLSEGLLSINIQLADSIPNKAKLIQSLPRSLTRLDISLGKGSQWTEELISALPPGLVTFANAPAVQCDPNLTRLLPRTLTTISRLALPYINDISDPDSDLSAVEVAKEGIKMLPKGISDFPGYASAYWIPYFRNPPRELYIPLPTPLLATIASTLNELGLGGSTLSRHHFEYLTPLVNLKTLSLELETSGLILTAEMMQMLPSGLETLSISNGGTAVLDATFFAALPRGITSLDIDSDAALHFGADSAQALPSTLKRLSTPNFPDNESSNAWFSHLPSSLQKITTQQPRLCDMTGLGLACPNLRYFSACDAKTSSPDDLLTLIRSLPRSLEFIRIEMAEDTPTISLQVSEIAAALPPKTRTVSFSPFAIEPEAVKTLKDQLPPRVIGFVVNFQNCLMP